MAGKIKLKNKPFNPAKDTLPVVHDRRAQDLNRGVVVEVIEIDDPLGLNPGDKVAVLINLRNDPLRKRLSDGHIDNAQYEAGRSYQKDFELASTTIRAIDAGKEYVDGGVMVTMAEAQEAAFDRLRKADTALGEEGTMIVQQVLVHGFFMEDVANARGFSGKGWVEFFGKRFRLCLETLALVYGHTTKKLVLSGT